MEKGFNDKELADIMSEIESLEREFNTEAPRSAPIEASSPVLQELAEAPVETSLPQSKVVPMSKPHHSAPASAPSCLSFKVEGEMTVSLKFEVNGQCVSLAVTEQGLEIETESGAKFSLPLHGQSSRPAA